jgi:type III pantothenate kinase
VLTRYDFQMVIDVDAPEQVGIDRLAAGLAAYHMRHNSASVIVIDAGTAITVDRVDEPGVFRGGAIFPGPFLLADSLHRHTYALPLVHVPDVPPSPVGKNTDAAISSGVFWGMVGAIRELVRRVGADLKAPPEIFFTGGAEQTAIADLIGARQVPDLVLRGIAMAGVPLVGCTPSSSA